MAVPKFNDLQVLPRSQFESVATADYMVLRMGEVRSAIGWIYKTENDEFDARQWNELPIGIYPDLEQAAYAIGQATLAMRATTACPKCDSDASIPLGTDGLPWYRCRSCGNDFSVELFNVIHDSRVD